MLHEDLSAFLCVSWEVLAKYLFQKNILACFPYFEKIKVGLCDHHAICIPPPPLVDFWLPEPVFMKLGMCIMLTEPISTAYFRNPSHQSVCLYMYPQSLLGNVSVKKRYPGKEYTHNNRKVRVVFYEVHVVSEESRQWVLPRTLWVDVVEVNEVHTVHPTRYYRKSYGSWDNWTKRKLAYISELAALHLTTSRGFTNTAEDFGCLLFTITITQTFSHPSLWVYMYIYLI
jgi:hypothetical protein